MNYNFSTDLAKAYYDGILGAAFGCSILNGKIEEWQIDAAKECALKLKESEIDHTMLSYSDKENLKRQWKQALEAMIQGFKNELRTEGRMDL